MKPRVLLLNPPGSYPYTRDYFCSKVAKTLYVEHPIDLVVLSGVLWQEAEIRVLDAILRRLSPAEALDECAAFRPEVVFFLTGSASAWEDFPFLEKLKAKTSARLYGLGDILRSERVVERLPWLDGALLDFMSDDALHLVRGEDTELQNAIVRSPRIRKFFRAARGECRIPVPRHESFIDKRYSFPFVRQLPFASVMTDFGCPYSCAFCVNGTLGYKTRPVENVKEELEYLKQLGVKELFLRDETFGVPRPRAQTLAEALAEFSWTCFSRADVLDAAFLKLIRDCGCHTVIVGVETGTAPSLREHKNLSLERVRECFADARALGLETVGTFILGLPGEDRAAAERTIEAAVSLGCDYASFNVFVPRADTPLSNGEWRGEIWDQSGILGARANGILSAEEIRALRKRAARRFYLRPGYLIGRLRATRLRNMGLALRNGIRLVRTLL